MEQINGELLTKLIQEKGLTLKELARISQISRNTIHNISAGKNNPSYLVMNDLINILDLTEKDFILTFFPGSVFKKESNL
ncbi:MAG: helix-turn-helix domain-containing protein [Atopostipes suicloacalis]|nr:helix-turn-helix domain-containing protein [Atopostipes suicloacalis]